MGATLLVAGKNPQPPVLNDNPAAKKTLVEHAEGLKSIVMKHFATFCMFSF